MENENTVVIKRLPRKASDTSIIAFTFMLITCGLNLIFGIGTRIFGTGLAFDLNVLINKLEFNINLTVYSYRAILDCLFFLPLFWQIPMTVYYRLKTKEGNNVGVGFGICTLIFVNLIGGICILTETKEKDKSVKTKVEEKKELTEEQKEKDEPKANKNESNEEKENYANTETTENDSSEDGLLNQEDEKEWQYDEDGVIKEEKQEVGKKTTLGKELLFASLTSVLNDTFIIERDEPLSKYTNNDLGDTVVDFTCVSSKTQKVRLFIKLIEKEDPNTIYKLKVKVVQPNGLEEEVPFIVFKLDEPLDDAHYVKNKIAEASK